ncbi:MAG: arsenate reductase ArsC [Deltaproteobacteria bacterium]|nr:arsenate reductase ArsC [Deltaproteobacteria bacterium]
MKTPVTVVLFACGQNAGRSQMAAAFFNSLADPSVARAISAGTSPASSVHAEVVLAMKEVGVDLSEARPQKLSLELASTAQLLVTMGCGEPCPFIAGVRHDDWLVADPQGQSLERVRQVRDTIRRRVQSLVVAEGFSEST